MSRDSNITLTNTELHDFNGQRQDRSNMKQISRGTTDSGDKQSIKKYILINDHPQEVSHDSNEVQAMRKATTLKGNQGRVRGLDYEGKSLIQASSGSRAHLDFKARLIRDRAWIQQAYLQGTLPQNRFEGQEVTVKRPHPPQSTKDKSESVSVNKIPKRQFPKDDTDKFNSAKKKRSSKQPETQSDVAMVTKKLTLNVRSPETFAAKVSMKDTLVAGHSTSSNRALKGLQTSEVVSAERKSQVAEHKETTVHNRSVTVPEVVYPHQPSHMKGYNTSEIGMQLHSRKKDTSEREAGDKSVLPELKVLPATQKEESTRSSSKHAKSESRGKMRRATVTASRDRKGSVYGIKYENTSFQESTNTRTHLDTKRRLTMDKALLKEAYLQESALKHTPKRGVDTRGRPHSDQSTKSKSELPLSSKNVTNTKERQISNDNVDNFNSASSSSLKQASKMAIDTKKPRPSSMKSPAIVTATDSIKKTSSEDQSTSSRVMKEQTGFPNQKRDKFKSNERKLITECQERKGHDDIERRLTTRDKASTKLACFQGTASESEKEAGAVTLEHIHLAQYTKDKSGSVVPSKNDHSSDASETPRIHVSKDDKGTLKPEWEKKSTRQKKTVSDMAMITKELAPIPLNEFIKVSVTARAKDSVKKMPVKDESRISIEQSGFQASKAERTKHPERQARNRSVMEMVILKHPHQSHHMNNYSDVGVQMHPSKSNTSQKQAGDKSVSTKFNDVESTTQKYVNTACVSESTPLHLSLESTKVHHAKRENKVTAKKPPKRITLEDPESATHKVGARKRKKATVRQHIFKYLPWNWSKVYSTDTSKEGPEKSKWNQKGDYEERVPKKGVQMQERKSDGNTPAVASGTNLNKDGEPVLPDRGYLEDIDFVVNEFDMILRTEPDLPARAYLEDIDFVSKEFDLFFRRKPEHQVGQETSILAHNDGASGSSDEGEESSVSKANESPHHQLWDGDENVENQNGATASIFNSNPPCDHYQPLVFNQHSNQEDVYVQLTAPTVSASYCAPNYSEGHYQPLISRRQDPSSEYDLVAFKPFEPSTTPAKSQKTLMKEEEDIHYKSIPGAHDQFCGDDNHVQHQGTTVSSVSDCSPTSEHYQPLIFKKQREYPIYVGINIDPEQPPTLSGSTSEGTIDKATDSNEGHYQPLIFDRQECQIESDYMPFTTPRATTVGKVFDETDNYNFSGKQTMAFTHSASPKSSKKIRQPEVRMETAAIYENLPSPAMHQIQETTAAVMAHKSRRDQYKDHLKHNTFVGNPVHQAPEYERYVFFMHNNY